MASSSTLPSPIHLQVLSISICEESLSVSSSPSLRSPGHILAPGVWISVSAWVVPDSRLSLSHLPPRYLTPASQVNPPQICFNHVTVMFKNLKWLFPPHQIYTVSPLKSSMIVPNAIHTTALPEAPLLCMRLIPSLKGGCWPGSPGKSPCSLLCVFTTLSGHPFLSHPSTWLRYIDIGSNPSSETCELFDLHPLDELTSLSCTFQIPKMRIMWPHRLAVRTERLDMLVCSRDLINARLLCLSFLNQILLIQTQPLLHIFR